MQKFIKFIKIAIPAMIMILATIFLFSILVFRTEWIHSILSVLGVIFLGLIFSTALLALGLHYGKKVQFVEQQKVVHALNARHSKELADQKRVYEAAMEADRKHHSEVIAKMEDAHSIQISALSTEFSKLLGEEELLVEEISTLENPNDEDA